MSAAALDDDDRLSVPPWTRLRYCRVRKQWLLLAPEKVLFPCPTSRAILGELDGRPLGDVIDGLAAAFGEERSTIEADIKPLLADLVGQGVVTVNDRG